jgi:hypothetical protein
MEVITDPALLATLAHLDRLDRLVEDTTRSPLSQRLRLPRSDFEFLLAALPVSAPSHATRLQPLFARTAIFHDYVNLSVIDLGTLVHMVRQVVASVSIDEAIQRG